jgi:hypothetical protein
MAWEATVHVPRDKCALAFIPFELGKMLEEFAFGMF